MVDVERKQGKNIESGLAQVPMVRETEILTLDQAREKFLTDPNPESMTKLNRSFWMDACRREGKGRQIIIPNLPKTVEVGNDMIAFFNPEEVSLVDLGNMFPKMGSWATQERAKIIDDNDNSGHFLAKMTVEAPYEKSTRGEFNRQLEKLGEQQMSLKHYIIFGQMMCILKGKYPNQNSTWSILSSCYKGDIIYASFEFNGDLNVESAMAPWYHNGYLSGRGEKKVVELT